MPETRTEERELTLATTLHRADLCGLAYTNPLEYLCSAQPAYAVTSNVPTRQGMTFLVCVEHAHLARTMRWFESMRSLPRD